MIKQFLPSNKIFKFEQGLKIWQLRHSKVIQLVDNQKLGIRKIIDFGCNDGLLVQKLQRGTTPQLIIAVDIDPQVLSRTIYTISPQATQQDIQYIRSYDQRVILYQGSALTQYPQFKQLQIDLVTLVQVIQHIEQKYIDLLNQNIFNYMRPKYVFISTPNSQFNVLFNWDNKHKFRHYDHKFEWTREEFKKYVEDVSEKYGYKFEISGVGEAIKDEANVGYCSQIVLFTRIDILEAEMSTAVEQVPNQFNQYQRQKRKQQNIINNNISEQQSQIQQLKYIPLKIFHQHTNYSWRSQKQQLASIALQQVVFSLRQHQVISWQQFINELRKKLIFEKLSQLQLDNNTIKEYVIMNLKDDNTIMLNDNFIKFYQPSDQSSVDFYSEMQKYQNQNGLNNSSNTLYKLDHSSQKKRKFNFDDNSSLSSFSSSQNCSNQSSNQSSNSNISSQSSQISNQQSQKRSIKSKKSSNSSKSSKKSKKLRNKNLNKKQQSQNSWLDEDDNNERVIKMKLIMKKGVIRSNRNSLKTQI